jgi:ADP-ribose pyrophosphatase YjhB (NUDIX family)
VIALSNDETDYVVVYFPPKAVRDSSGHEEAWLWHGKVQWFVKVVIFSDISGMDQSAPKVCTVSRHSACKSFFSNGYPSSFWHPLTYWCFSGTGGKFDPSDVTIEQTAIRECHEECGLKPKKLSKCGIIKFAYQGKPAWDNECHIFTADIEDCDGEVMETEEMHPQWFAVGEIPYKSMWDDDEIWFEDTSLKVLLLVC